MCNADHQILKNSFISKSTPTIDLHPQSVLFRTDAFLKKTTQRRLICFRLLWPFCNEELLIEGKTIPVSH